MLKGTHMTAESRAKLSAVRKGRPSPNKGQPSPLRGCKRSPETIAKMSAGKMGHTVSAETRAKISARTSAAQLGMRPRWRYPVGTTTEKDGYLRVKVAEPRVWRFVHRLVYEIAYGPIPRAHHVHHRDLNPLNNDPENLQAMTKVKHRSLHGNLAQHLNRKVSLPSALVRL